jgi:hypothetical protein
LSTVPWRRFEAGGEEGPGSRLGILTAIAGFLDIGDLMTNAVAGSRFGMSLAWVVVGVVGICLFAQIAGRVAAVSGRATFEITVNDSALVSRWPTWDIVPDQPDDDHRGNWTIPTTWGTCELPRTKCCGPDLSGGHPRRLAGRRPVADHHRSWPMGDDLSGRLLDVQLHFLTVR